MEQFVEDKDVISFSSLFKIFWRWKWLIVVITFLSAAASVFYAIKQPDVYRSQLISMTPSDKSQGGLSGMSGQLGGLAGLAGISLGGSSEKSLKQIIELIKSRDFLQSFIERHNLTADLIAAVGWDKANNKIIYNPELYDDKTKQWVRTAPPGKAVIPTSWEAYPTLLKSILVIEMTKKSILKLSVDHYSPYIAKKWVELLLSDINTLYRERAKQEAVDSIDFLNKASERARLTEIRNMMSGLLEDQMKTAMLSEVRKEFALETLSAAVLPEDKNHPKRALIAIVGTVFGGVFSLLLVMIANMIFPNKRKKLNKT